MKFMKKQSMFKLTVSIVNYNAGDYLIRCLESLETVEGEAEMEIYVVDNASSDESTKRAQELFPKIHFILNQENAGFGKAHNQVLRIFKTEYILILNPDVEVKKGNISKMLQFMEEDPDAGVATPEIVLPDGKIDLTAHRGLPTPWASFKYFVLKDDSLYHLTKADFSKPHEVDSVSGAFLLTRKSVLDKVGLFDEDYFLYAEDIDLCYRIKKAGFKIMYVPAVKVLHHKGVSSGLKKHSLGITTANLETRKRSLDAFYETMKIFYKKHLAKNYPSFINWTVYLGINLKWWLAKRKLTV